MSSESTSSRSLSSPWSVSPGTGLVSVTVVTVVNLPAAGVTDPIGIASKVSPATFGVIDVPTFFQLSNRFCIVSFDCFFPFLISVCFFLVSSDGVFF